MVRGVVEVGEKLENSVSSSESNLGSKETPRWQQLERKDYAPWGRRKKVVGTYRGSVRGAS